jgi:hypothetical protein
MSRWNAHWSQKTTGTTTAARHQAETANASISPRTPPGPQRKDQLLTTDEAALWLRLSRRTLERYRVTGGGPAYVKLGPGKRSRVAYREDDLTSWLEASIYRSTAEYER